MLRKRSWVRIISILFLGILSFFIWNNKAVYADVKSKTEIRQDMISNAEEAKYVPTYVIPANDRETPVFLYNPYSAELAANLIKDIPSGHLKDQYDIWSKPFLKEGCEQLYCIDKSALYKADFTGTLNKVWFTGLPFTALITNDHLDAVIGLKKSVYNGKNIYTVIIVIRGSKDLHDWITDVGVHQKKWTNGRDTHLIHEGFYDSAKQLYKLCKKIKFEVEGETYTVSDIMQNRLQYDSKFRMFIAGHSLGGVTANLFSGLFLANEAHANNKNFVAYTFASPRSYSCDCFDSFDNIFNIVSNDDFVPGIPSSAQRIGTDIFFTPLVSADHPHYMKEYVKGLKSINDSLFANKGEIDMIPHNTEKVEFNEIVSDDSSYLGWFIKKDEVSEDTSTETVIDNRPSNPGNTGGTTEEFIDWKTLFSSLINEKNSQVGYMDLYSLYDIDKNGIPEIFIQKGMSESDAITRVYRATSEFGPVEIDSFYSGNTVVCGIDKSGSYLLFYGDFARSGIDLCTLREGVGHSTDTIYSTDSDNDDILTHIIPVQTYDLSDQSGLAWNGDGNGPVNNSQLLRGYY